MKRVSADDSADSRVKVGHRQAIYPSEPLTACAVRGFVFGFGELEIALASFPLDRADQGAAI